MEARTEPVDDGREVPSRNGHHEHPERTGAVVERVDDGGVVHRETVDVPARESVVERRDAGQSAVEHQSAVGQSVEEPAVERASAVGQSVEEPAVERPAVERPTVEPSVEERPAVEPPAEEHRSHPQLRALLLALPAALVALWLVAFLPLQLGLVLGAMAALPVAIVAVPWMVSLAATALVDRGL